MNANYSYRNCNDEVAIKLLSNLTKEIPELEHNMPKQLQIMKLQVRKLH